MHLLGVPMAPLSTCTRFIPLLQFAKAGLRSSPTTSLTFQFPCILVSFYLPSETTVRLGMPALQALITGLPIFPNLLFPPGWGPGLRAQPYRLSALFLRPQQRPPGCQVLSSPLGFQALALCSPGLWIFPDSPLIPLTLFPSWAPGLNTWSFGYRSSLSDWTFHTWADSCFSQWLLTPINSYRVLGPACCSLALSSSVMG